MSTLRLALRRRRAEDFSALLQGGVLLEVPAGTSVRDLLVRQLDLTPHYVANRISTVFLDGGPVDDLRTATLREGSSLALSAAMPGLVGGTMRSGSPLAAFRSTVSHRPDRPGAPGRPVTVRVKLFNLLMEEVGLPLLEQGVLVEASRLAAFLSRAWPSLREGSCEISSDGRTLGAGLPVEEALRGSDDPVRLVVQFEE